MWSMTGNEMEPFDKWKPLKQDQTSLALVTPDERTGSRILQTDRDSRASRCS